MKPTADCCRIYNGMLLQKLNGICSFCNEISWTLSFLGLLDFTGLRTLVKTNTPINTSNALSQICNFLMVTFLYQTNSHCNTYFIFFNLDPFEPQCNIQFPSSPPTWVLVEKLQTFQDLVASCRFYHGKWKS